MNSNLNSTFPPPRARSCRHPGEKFRVLSVDDDPINQMVIQSLLTPEGYDVTQAMDGEEALDILEKGKMLPDIVLLDVMMPGMSGFQVGDF